MYYRQDSIQAFLFNKMGEFVIKITHNFKCPVAKQEVAFIKCRRKYINLVSFDETLL